MGTCTWKTLDNSNSSGSILHLSDQGDLRPVQRLKKPIKLESGVPRLGSMLLQPIQLLFSFFFFFKLNLL